MWRIWRARGPSASGLWPFARDDRAELVFFGLRCYCGCGWVMVWHVWGARGPSALGLRPFARDDKAELVFFVCVVIAGAVG